MKHSGTTLKTLFEELGYPRGHPVRTYDKLYRLTRTDIVTWMLSERGSDDKGIEWARDFLSRKWQDLWPANNEGFVSHPADTPRYSLNYTQEKCRHFANQELQNPRPSGQRI